MSLVVGVDAAKAAAWVAVALRGGRLHEISAHPSLDAILQGFPEARAIAIDIPLGHEDPSGAHAGGQRRCDRAAREILLPERRSSVFWVPPPAAMEAEDHARAVALCRSRGWTAPSAQLWALRPRILEAQRHARDPRIHEVHPELSFHALAQTLARSPPAHGKQTWAGLIERLQLLHEARLRPERSLGGVGRASPDDVLDATIAAWTAHRIAEKKAEAAPADPPQDPQTHRRVAIWR